MITIPWATSAGRQVTARIGACVRCAQWFNEAGLRELEWAEPRREERADQQGAAGQ